MLIELDVERVAGRADIVGPQLLLHEAHAVEHLLGLAAAAIGEFLGIPELATDPLHRARLAADVIGCADMAGRIAAPDAHGRANGKTRGHFLTAMSGVVLGAEGPSGRFSMSAS